MYNLLMPKEEAPKALLIDRRASQPSRWLRFLGKTLSDEGFTIEFAGRRGLVGKLRRENFRTVFVDWDWDLADNGRPLVSLIKQHAPFLPIIATVMIEDHDTIRRIFKAGFSDICSQNYDRYNLLTTLRKREIIT